MTTDVLVEATRPHFATDEGQKFLKGQATQDEIRVRLLLPCYFPILLTLYTRYVLDRT